MRSRRAGVAGAVVATLLAGCSSPAVPPAPEPTVDPTQRTSSDATSGPVEPSATAAVTPEPPALARYRPHPAEVDGDAKRVAARAVERLPGVERVTYTQYFGYQPPLASILVEADFATGAGTTYDVRISQDDGAGGAAGRWRVDSVEPAAPVPPVRDPGPLARRVLASKRIDLPWAGRADVAGGLIADEVLRSMLAVAKRNRIGISVLVSAHPVQVFGTDRRSNHPDGTAYDIGRIDGRLVVEPGAAELVRDVMRVAAGTGAYQVGGPEDLDGGDSQYFSDVTHSEHVHVGFGG